MFTTSGDGIKKPKPDVPSSHLTLKFSVGHLSTHIFTLVFSFDIRQKDDKSHMI